MKPERYILCARTPVRRGDPEWGIADAKTFIPVKWYYTIEEAERARKEMNDREKGEQQ